MCKYNLRVFEQDLPIIKPSKLKGHKKNLFLVVKGADVYSYVNKASLYWKSKLKQKDWKENRVTSNMATLFS